MDDGLLYSHKQILIQNNFTFCLKHLAAWLNQNSIFGYKKVSILLDNCSSHRAKTTLDYLKAKNWSIFFLPPYSPQLAPVELAFNHIKSQIRFQDRETLLKFSKTEALCYTLKLMGPIAAKSVRGYYAKFFQTVGNFLPIFKTLDLI